MSASQCRAHFSNAIIPFPRNPSKPPPPFLHFTPKYTFTTFSNAPANRSLIRANAEASSTAEHESQQVSQAKSSESNPQQTIKAPTAPWMNKPLLVKPHEMMDITKRNNRSDYSASNGNGEHRDAALTRKVGGGRGRVAMKKIFKGIGKLGETENSEENKQALGSCRFKFAPGALWGNGDYESDAEVQGNCEGGKECFGSGKFDIPLGEVVKELKLRKMPWEGDEKTVTRRVMKEKVATFAELNLDRNLLERLRDEAAKMKKWVKVKKAGVTQAVVDEVHSIWRNDELALIKFDVPLCWNMGRAREIVEMKSGGIVVWRKKDFLAVYRGCNYKSCSKHIWTRRENSSSNKNYGKGNLHMTSLYEREANRLLDGLGPRFVDWWTQKPLPVDADLLPELVTGLKTPFRLSPPFTRSKLTDAELTYLRKLARPLPTHFVLGRNRKLQGLAAAILKLWEKCHIAKIAVKWGVQNTDNEQMANELKAGGFEICILTGGVLLLRNKFFIVLYRGKDFMPSEVAKIVNERELALTKCQLQEEAARIKASEAFSITDEQTLTSGSAGTLSEFHIIDSDIRSLKKSETEVEIQLKTEEEKLKKELKDQERRLYILKKKIEKSVKILEKLNTVSRFSEKDPDVEVISEEERRCLREMGVKIDRSLVLGRRGVYDGVIEGMHQHWKHREIVKVITMQKTFSQVMRTAKCVETESGGIVVSIVKLKEGHAIIVYRGKNYKRPKLAAINLLNKREALSRSLELQRLGSLKFFARQRKQAITVLKCKLDTLHLVRNDRGPLGVGGEGRNNLDRNGRGGHVNFLDRRMRKVDRDLRLECGRGGDVLESVHLDKMRMNLFSGRISLLGAWLFLVDPVAGSFGRRL
ncbi:Chloroplastic group IIA intron splicing facilitator CRS1- chloroplastic [Striga hermonthica]|uniref:Chloroplastic group IIA intron splicing facilitator CRS1- chloroplastic n=1 Tax=Striga hermonthica TaxID=68872 RepID=A0A9N7MVP7_STRHE|nr:Chloroplastic group IIA intron splicing facilitator CRS1- chloroplastic [Striga hermonthica]